MKDFSNHLKFLKKKYPEFYKKKLQEINKTEQMKFSMIFD